MNYSVIIADDEPLTLAGLNSLIDWQKEGFEIVSQARNGVQLEDAIRAYQPDIVLTDIRMPLKSGLDVMESVKKLDIQTQFILLTSHEEFDYVKSALSLGAIEYLIKLELTPESLINALRKACNKISDTHTLSTGVHRGLQILQERFFIRAFFRLEERGRTLDEQMLSLDLNLKDRAMRVAYVSLINDSKSESKVKLHMSALSLFKNTVSRYIDSYSVVLDINHFALILCLKEGEDPCFQALSSATRSIKDLLSLKAYVSLGNLVYGPEALAESFQRAKFLSPTLNDKTPFREVSTLERIYNPLNIDNAKIKLKSALDEMDSTLLQASLSDIVNELTSSSFSAQDSLDVAVTVLYMVFSLLPDGERLIEEIFSSSEMLDYKVLYHITARTELLHWFKILESGLLSFFNERRQDYRAMTVQRIQSYVSENLSRKLTLSEVADVFGYSQGYLSTLFSKTAGVSLTDYITKEKVMKAKELLNEGMKVYLVAEKLGFESSFYFSKVFKKVTGHSPSEINMQR